MTTPVYDEQFLPRLVAIFFATFHPTEGPKVVYQVPEGSIAQDGDPSEVDSNESLDLDHDAEQFREKVERHEANFDDMNSNQDPSKLNQQSSQQPSLPPVDEVTTPSAATSFQTGYNDPRPPTMEQGINSEDSDMGPGASEFTVLRDRGISNFTIRDPSSGISSLDTLSLPVVSSSSYSEGSESEDSESGPRERVDRRRLSRDSQGRPQIRPSSEASKAPSLYSTAASFSRFHRSGNVSKPEPLFDFSPLAEYVIPKAPLCGRLVTCTTRARVGTASLSEDAAISLRKARSRARSGKATSRPGSRTSSAAPSSNRLHSPPDSPNSSNDLPRQNDIASEGFPAGTSSSRAAPSSYKILSHPVLINDPVKYARNTYIFNIGFVFDGRADTRAYEPVVRKCARVVRGLEEASSFLSNPASMPRMYGIIEQLFEDLNSYCESFVALPDTPHTNWIEKHLQKNKASRENRSTRHNSNASGGSLSRPAFKSRAASSSSSGSELPNSQLKEDAELEGRGGLSSQGSNANSGKGSNAALIALLTQTPASLSRRVSTEVLGSTSTDGTSGLTSLSPGSGVELSSSSSSSSNSQSTASLSISRPAIGRSTTAAAVTAATVTTATNSNDVVGGESEKTDENRQSTNSLNGNVIAGHDSLRSGENIAPEMQGDSMIKRNGVSNPLPKAANAAPVLASSISTTAPSRVTSGSSTSTTGIDTTSSNLSESILSLRTIGPASERAPVSTSVSGTENGIPGNSVNLKAPTNKTIKNKEDAAQPLGHATGAPGISLPGRRDPPHGLGRTVRDAINLKLFPTYANPPPVNDWDVPVALLRLDRMIDANWDLTMARVCPYIDGVNHVKRIAQMADADLELTRQCMEHLIYYGCIILTDLFQFFNMYTVRPLISRMAADPVVRSECPTYVTRPGYRTPSYPTLLRLYSLMRPGLTLHEWIEENEAELDLESMGIDVRRFTSFGVIKGFLRRVHRYPILLPDEFDPGSEDSPEIKSRQRGRESSPGADGKAASRSGSALERVKAGGSRSRERDCVSTATRGHRDSDVPAMSGFDLRAKSNSRSREREDVSNDDAPPPTTRSRKGASEIDFTITNDYGVRERLPSNRTASWGRSASSQTQTGSSPTKRQLNRPLNRSKKSQRHPTATVVDVATIALEHLQDDQEARRPPSGTGSGIPLQAQGRTSSFKKANTTGFPPSPSKKASFGNLPTYSGDSNRGASGSSKTGLESQHGTTFPRSTSLGGVETPQSSGISDLSRAFTCLPIPPELPELLDGTHCDDELCVRFGLSWSELQRMLIVIGMTPPQSDQFGRSGSGERGGYGSEEEMNREVGTTAAENSQSASAFTSGYGNVSSASGYIRRSFPRSRKSSNALRAASGNATAGGRWSSGWGGINTSRANSSGWNAESEGAMNSGWASSGGLSLDPKALEKGDYGRVKIILR